jgi:putative membrane protein
MAAVDEIALHQVFGWHHFYDRSTSQTGLLSDGLLHAVELVALVGGFSLWADARRSGRFSPPAAWACLFLGAGGFQLSDAIINHKVLVLHQIRYGIKLAPYDTAWNASGAAFRLGIAAVELLAVAAVVYLAATVTENRTGSRSWPHRRSVLWLSGVAVLAATVVGPVAELAHDSLTAHMVSHIAAGMLAPLLMVMAAPVTLALRTQDAVPARRVSRLLRSSPARFISHPIPAGVINFGSPWLLYGTAAGRPILDSPALHYVLLGHFFVAGHLFTASIVGIDPSPHRARLSLRVAVVFASITVHSVLAKHLYAFSSAGASVRESERAGGAMFYGGDLLELALLVVLFSQWYRKVPVAIPFGGANRRMARLEIWSSNSVLRV